MPEDLENKVIVKLRNGEELSGEVIIGAGGSYDLVSKRIREIERMPMNWRDEDIAMALYFEVDVGREFMYVKDQQAKKEEAFVIEANFSSNNDNRWNFTMAHSNEQSQ